MYSIDPTVLSDTRDGRIRLFFKSTVNSHLLRNKWCDFMWLWVCVCVYLCLSGRPVCVWRHQCVELNLTPFFVHPQRRVPHCFLLNSWGRRLFCISANAAGNRHPTRHRVGLSSGPRWHHTNVHFGTTLVRAPPVSNRVPLCAKRTWQRGRNGASFNGSNVRQRSLFRHWQLCLYRSVVTNLCDTQGSLARLSVLHLHALPSSGHFK